MSQLLKANFIGCGKLGKTIAHLLNKNKLIQMQDVYNRTVPSNEKAISFIEGGHACTDLNKLSHADLYFISTPDDQIEEVCKKITSNEVTPKSIFVHFSGSLTSDILASAKDKGHEVCSLHPIRSFANPEESAKSFDGTYCAFEGSDKAYSILSEMISKIGGKVFTIQKEKKSVYHAAGVFACNYLTTLADFSSQCYLSSGIPEETSKKIIVSLMRGTIENISNSKSLPDALTGPIQRGDVNTIKKHIASLESMSELEECYKMLGKATLKLSKVEALKKAEILNELK
jgi:predicted short-subunit dehydrogenase-like oxidoreductase (DUF2520 family)